jgi:hypothetical protein
MTQFKQAVGTENNEGREKDWVGFTVCYVDELTTFIHYKIPLYIGVYKGKHGWTLLNMYSDI